MYQSFIGTSTGKVRLTTHISRPVFVSHEHVCDSSALELDNSAIPVPYTMVSEALSVPGLIEGDVVPPPKRMVLTRATFNAALLASAATMTLFAVCLATFQYAEAGGSPHITLISVIPATWWVYKRAVTVHPITVKAILTGNTYVLGDMIAQVIQLRQAMAVAGERELSHKSTHPVLLMDPWRYVRSGVVGLVVLGPLAHYYYDFVASFLSSWPWPFKVLLDQTVYLAFYNTIYYVLLGMLAGRSLASVWSSYCSQFWALLMAGWKLWPAIGIITYNFVPTEHRVLFVDAVEVIYSAVLSWFVNDIHHAVSEKRPAHNSYVGIRISKPQFSGPGGGYPRILGTDAGGGVRTRGWQEREGAAHRVGVAGGGGAVG